MSSSNFIYAITNIRPFIRPKNYSRNTQILLRGPPGPPGPPGKDGKDGNSLIANNYLLYTNEIASSNIRSGTELIANKNEYNDVTFILPLKEIDDLRITDDDNVDLFNITISTINSSDKTNNNKDDIDGANIITGLKIRIVPNKKTVSINTDILLNDSYIKYDILSRIFLNNNIRISKKYGLTKSSTDSNNIYNTYNIYIYLINGIYETQPDKKLIDNVLFDNDIIPLDLLSGINLQINTKIISTVDP
jgi:hypothetical protein